MDAELDRRLAEAAAAVEALRRESRQLDLELEERRKRDSAADQVEALEPSSLALRSFTFSAPGGGGSADEAPCWSRSDDCVAAAEAPDAATLANEAASALEQFLRDDAEEALASKAARSEALQKEPAAGEVGGFGGEEAEEKAPREPEEAQQEEEVPLRQAFPPPPPEPPPPCGGGEATSWSASAEQAETAVAEDAGLEGAGAEEDAELDALWAQCLPEGSFPSFSSTWREPDLDPDAPLSPPLDVELKETPAPLQRVGPRRGPGGASLPRPVRSDFPSEKDVASLSRRERIALLEGEAEAEAEASAGAGASGRPMRRPPPPAPGRRAADTSFCSGRGFPDLEEEEILRLRVASAATNAAESLGRTARGGRPDGDASFPAKGVQGSGSKEPLQRERDFSSSAALEGEEALGPRRERIALLERLGGEDQDRAPRQRAPIPDAPTSSGSRGHPPALSASAPWNNKHNNNDNSHNHSNSSNNNSSNNNSSNNNSSNNNNNDSNNNSYNNNNNDSNNNSSNNNNNDSNNNSNNNNSNSYKNTNNGPEPSDDAWEDDEFERRRQLRKVRLAARGARGEGPQQLRRRPPTSVDAVDAEPSAASAEPPSSLSRSTGRSGPNLVQSPQEAVEELDRSCGQTGHEHFDDQRFLAACRSLAQGAHKLTCGSLVRAVEILASAGDLLLRLPGFDEQAREDLRLAAEALLSCLTPQLASLGASGPVVDSLRAMAAAQVQERTFLDLLLPQLLVLLRKDRASFPAPVLASVAGALGRLHEAGVSARSAASAASASASKRCVEGLAAAIVEDLAEFGEEDLARVGGPFLVNFTDDVQRRAVLRRAAELQAGLPSAAARQGGGCQSSESLLAAMACLERAVRSHSFAFIASLPDATKDYLMKVKATSDAHRKETEL